MSCPQFGKIALDANHGGTLGCFLTRHNSINPQIRALNQPLGVQNGPITKNTDLPLTTYFFGKIYFSIRTYCE